MEPLNQHRVITTGLFNIEIVISVVFWKSLSGYVIHDASELNERQECLSQVDRGLVACQLVLS